MPRRRRFLAALLRWDSWPLELKDASCSSSASVMSKIFGPWSARRLALLRDVCHLWKVRNTKERVASVVVGSMLQVLRPKSRETPIA